MLNTLRKLTKLPLLLVIFLVLLMYIVDVLNLVDSYAFVYQSIIAFTLFIVGLLVIVVSGILFRKAKTTVNPMNPEKATQLVNTGLYQYSRNPMYLGFFTWLLAFVILIGNPINILILPLYVLLANKLYIFPEEKALEQLFEKEFITYKNNVKRWI